MNTKSCKGYLGVHHRFSFQTKVMINNEHWYMHARLILTVWNMTEKMEKKNHFLPKLFVTLKNKFSWKQTHHAKTVHSGSMQNLLLSSSLYMFLQVPLLFPDAHTKNGLQNRTIILLHIIDTLNFSFNSTSVEPDVVSDPC